MKRPKRHRIYVDDGRRGHYTNNQPWKDLVSSTTYMGPDMADCLEYYGAIRLHKPRGTWQIT